MSFQPDGRRADGLDAVVTRARVRRRIERLTGFVMIGFGIRLALERR